MDSVTHLISGALTPLAFKNAPKTRALVFLGCVAGVFPDIDILGGTSPEALLSFHRGITHAIAVQPFFALLLALIFHRAVKKGDANGAWTFAKTWSVAFLALCIHLFLDCMTTFGTQIFLPFSDFRVAVPAMFIIDFFLTVPLLAALWIILRRGGIAAPDARRTPTARRALAWLAVYPFICLGVNQGAALYLGKVHAAPGNAEGVVRMELSPEPFSPFVWKAVGVTRDSYLMGRFLLPLPEDGLRFTQYERVSPVFWNDLQREAPLFSLYAHFASYPYETVAHDPDGTVVHTFRDVRYESVLPGLMDAVGRGDGIFLLQARLRDGHLAAYRFLHRGREAAATPWRTANAPGGADRAG